MSAMVELGDGSEGFQWAAEGVSMAGEGPVETRAQRQWVRVGAASVSFVVASKTEKSSDVDDGVEKSIVAGLGWVVMRAGSEFEITISCSSSVRYLY